MIHAYFDQQRVVRPELYDGKTEWFLVTWSELREVILALKTYMARMFGDNEKIDGVQTRARSLKS